MREFLSLALQRTVDFFAQHFLPNSLLLQKTTDAAPTPIPVFSLAAGR